MTHMTATELKSAVELGNFVEQSVELKSLKTTLEIAQEKMEKQKALNALLTRMELRKDPTTGKYTIRLDDPKDPTGCGTYEFTSPDLLQGFAKDVLKMDGKLSIIEKNGVVEMELAESVIANQVDDLKQTIAIKAPSNVTITNNVTTTYAESTSSDDAKKISGGSAADATNTAAKSGETAMVSGKTVGKEGAKDVVTATAEKEGVKDAGKDGAAKTTEVIKEKTDAEKIAEAKALIAGLGLQVVAENTPNGSQKVINLTPAQYESLKKINLLYPGISMMQPIGVDDGFTSGEGQEKKSVGKYDRQIDKIQDLIDNGHTRRAERKTKKLYKEAHDGAEVSAKLDALSRGFANEQSRETYHTRVAQSALNISRGGQYLGQTIAVEPYHPLFINICQNVNAMTLGSVIPLTVSGERVMLKAPGAPSLSAGVEQYPAGAQQFQNAVMGSTGYARMGAENPNSYGNKAANWLSEHTNLPPRDAKNAVQAVGVVAGVLAVGGALKWLFTGENPFKKGKSLEEHMKESMLWRAGAVIVGGLGLNFASKMANGRPLWDNIKDLYNGNMKFSDLIHSKSPVEQLGNNVDYSAAILSGMPMGVLSACSTPGANGTVSINAQKLYDYAIQQETLTTDPQQKLFWSGKKTVLANLATDANAQKSLNTTVSHMTTYNDIAKPENKEKNMDTILNEINTRKNTLLGYMTSQKLAFANEKDPQIEAYYYTGKPTIEDMKKSGLLVAVGNVDVAKSQANPEAGKEKLDTKLQSLVGHNGYTVENITTLVTAASAINGKKANAVTLETNDNGILYIRNAQGWDVPLTVNDNNYQIADLNIQFPKNQAEQALNIAMLTGKLIADHNGTAKEGMKNYFTVGFGDSRLQSLSVGARLGQGDLNFNDGVATISLVDGEDRWSSTAKELGGENFQTRMRLYADWLNGLKSTSGKSVWEKNSGVTNWKQMSYEAAVKTKVAEADKKQATTAGTTNTGSTNVVPVVVPTPSPDKPDATAKNDKKKEGGESEKEPIKKRTPEQAKEELAGLNDLISQTENVAAARGAIIDKTAKLLNEAYPQLGMRIEKGKGFIRVFSHGDAAGTKIDTVAHCVEDDQFGAGQFDSTPDRWRDLIRIACLTNWVKQNFKNRSTKDNPFELSGQDIQFDGKTFWSEIKEGDWRRLFFDTDVVDNEDNTGSTAKEIGGTAFQSQHSAYKDWLNRMKNKNGESIWRENVKLTPQTPEKGADGKLIEKSTAYTEMLQHIGAVKDSFNAISDTPGLGADGLQVEHIEMGTTLMKGTMGTDNNWTGYPVLITYAGKPRDSFTHMYINPDTREMAYNSTSGQMRVLKYPFSTSAKKDLLALAVLTDSIVQRFPNQGSGTEPINRSMGGDIEIALNDHWYSKDKEVLDESDMNGFCPWLKSNTGLYIDYLNQIGVTQRDEVAASMTKIGAANSDASITHATGRIM